MYVVVVGEIYIGETPPNTNITLAWQDNRHSQFVSSTGPLSFIVHLCCIFSGRLPTVHRSCSFLQSVRVFHIQYTPSPPDLGELSSSRIHDELSQALFECWSYYIRTCRAARCQRKSLTVLYVRCMCSRKNDTIIMVGKVTHKANRSIARQNFTTPTYSDSTKLSNYVYI